MCKSQQLSKTKNKQKILDKKAKQLKKANECNQCEYKSSYPSNLRVHKRIHSKEKPHKCYQCQYKCTQSSHLKVHKSVHSKNAAI